MSIQHEVAQNATIAHMKAWHFFVLSVVLFGIAILGLRHNDLTSLNIKTRIIQQDRAGEPTQDDINDLDQFSSTHMNASRRVVLEGAYKRAQAEARAEADNSVDGDVYEQAQNACDRQGQQTTANADCVQNYVQQRLDDSNANVDMPDKRHFTYEYHSPIWTDDVPGLSIAGGILGLLIGGVLYVRDNLRNLSQKKTDS